MAIAPITGMLRKRFWLDISTGLGLGVSAGAAFWYGYELRARAHQEAFYLKLEKEKLAAAQQ
ncbi:cytochrome-c oxidase subunit VIIa [Mycena polygramma]|nr:cytochrome-c oxidase subunit VIIa [Mycena vitilis]KAJ7642715.1 cytochrome-c oxidase subunit VIIa [Mycena polygramma]KAJ7654425.1 cytochrome-c oxidase subunit VIIa [Mycena polygramma]